MIQLKKIEDIVLNKNNPRKIKDIKLTLLVNSICEFPEMLYKRPLIVRTHKDGFEIIGGNRRYEAICKAIENFDIEKYPEKNLQILKKGIPVIIADDFTEEQQRQFIVRDNISAGEFDFDALTESYYFQELSEWGIDVPGINFDGTFAEEEQYVVNNTVSVSCESTEEAIVLQKQLLDMGYKAYIK